jgi:hypothetical protein
MPHLIQPIEIEAVKYCPTYHGNRATQGVATSLIGTPTVAPDVSTPASPWTVTNDGIATESEFSFGVACGDTVQVDFDAFGSYIDFLVSINIYVNGVGPVEIKTLTNASPSDSATISLTDEACGNIITFVVFISADDGDTAFVILSTDITGVS